MKDPIVFDTHRFIKRMTDAGLDEAIAEALADEQIALINSNLATKQDIAEVKQDIVEVKRDIEQLRAETGLAIAETKTELVKWMMGTQIAAIGIIVSLITFV